MSRNSFVNVAAALVGASVIVTCAMLSWVQIGYWRDSETLWAHTLAATENNAVGQNNYGATIERRGEMEADYGATMERRGEMEGAMHHYEQAAQLKEAAVPHYEEALQFKPNYADAHCNLGLARARQGDLKDAVHHLYLANHFDPRHEQWHYYLRSALQQYGAKLKQDGKPEEALQQYREAVRLYPDDADARYNLGVTLVQQGKLTEAREQFLMALWLSPNDPAAASNLRAVEQLIAKGKS